jgi:hypothetical protein
MLSEQPHYTTAVLDAGEVYHIGVEVRGKLQRGAETPTQGQRRLARAVDDFGHWG